MRAQRDLSEADERVVSQHAAWFRDLTRTPMSASYKMIALQAVVDAGELCGSMTVADNATLAFSLLQRSRHLWKEAQGDRERRQLGDAFVAKWRQMPLKIWASGRGTARRWFSLEGDELRSRIACAAEDRPILESLTAELVELRLHEHIERLRRKQVVDAATAPIQLRVSRSRGRPILRFDRAVRRDIPPIGETKVDVGGELHWFHFRKAEVNVVNEAPGEPNVLPVLLRRWFGLAAGQPGTRHRVFLEQTEAAVWRLRPDRAVDEGSTKLVPFPTLPFFSDLKVACGAFLEGVTLSEHAKRLHVQATRALEPHRHFVVRAAGESMNGGSTPIRDGDLVLCEWFAGGTAEEIAGHPFLLVGHETADTSFAVMKVPRRRDGSWVLESWNPEFPPRALPVGSRIEPVARVLEVVEEAGGLVLWGQYDRETVARSFGEVVNPAWTVDQRDVTAHGVPHTILFVTLRKDDQTRAERRYADRFLSHTELEWEPRASTTPLSAEGRRIIGHAERHRTIHLFARYRSRRPFIYCGPIVYLHHESESPMKVTFGLQHPLPDGLWELWGAV